MLSPWFTHPEQETKIMATIDPRDDIALEDTGKLFWLNELQRLRGLEGLKPEGASALKTMVFADVDALAIVTGKDCGCSREKATILVMPTGGTLTGATLLEASWAAYMLSLKATMDGGKNPRAHVGKDADAVELATSMAQRLGAFVTPYDEIYGSGGTYLEAIDLSYDPETRTLTGCPEIGS
jgi:hypothetical protein